MIEIFLQLEDYGLLDQQ